MHPTIEHLFRHESGKMLAVLVKLFGLNQVEIAEDIVQETLLNALESWKLKGLPDDPRAWLYRAAKNRTIDYLRRERNFKTRVAPNFQQGSSPIETSWLDGYFLDTEIEDAQLRMMFATCHPAIPIESQLALMLRTLCGLSTQEIAVAFFLPSDSIVKRLYRAKEKIRQEKLSLEVPAGNDLLPRLDAVLHAVYLLFNEGYKSASNDEVIRRELCVEAIRLGTLLARHPLSNQPKTHALLALMCFHAARLDARLTVEGEIILLENQDRSTWNQQLIALAYTHFKQSSQGEDLSAYHLEAAIASYHAVAPSFAQTNWQAIFYCYNLLYTLNPSPIVALNRAIAKGYAEGPSAGIEALLKIEGLDQNYLYHTALGDFYSKNGKLDVAKLAYGQALQLATLPAEKKVIEQKIKNN
ncbi:putative RNA polymerase, sigma-24 subunit, ECF subfamily [Haliscomenobacter hydrossis DSM 1100]|uniref:RNA polymerase, sigma-24 subunit, ECF subfamily n=1 Tax=Haliscomenobacter hydrossis (strain ATCC 27775 / DSM 1100 / LMG 10767 / O) TaxID=760192 RepID=F4KR94_HALH1|nr:putative RNA polymerase, sigma-24 subunit, ECF subfamily [Haliscomenobacter hydrossis DSM 1100]